MSRVGPGHGPRPLQSEVDLTLEACIALQTLTGTTGRTASFGILDHPEKAECGVILDEPPTNFRATPEFAVRPW